MLMRLDPVRRLQISGVYYCISQARKQDCLGGADLKEVPSSLRTHATKGPLPVKMVPHATKRPPTYLNDPFRLQMISSRHQRAPHDANRTTSNNVKLPEEQVTLPKQPITLPKGFPRRYKFNGHAVHKGEHEPVFPLFLCALPSAGTDLQSRWSVTNGTLLC